MKQHQKPNIKMNNPSLRNCHNQLSHTSLSHIEKECQESLPLEKIHIEQNLNQDLKYLKS